LNAAQFALGFYLKKQHYVEITFVIIAKMVLYES